jgi:hypothetical protein
VFQDGFAIKHPQQANDLLLHLTESARDTLLTAEPECVTGLPQHEEFGGLASVFTESEHVERLLFIMAA